MEKDTMEELFFVFPTANILELKTSFRIDIPAPGFANHEFKITAKDFMLTITARQNSEEGMEQIDYLRTMRLPEYMKDSIDNIQHRYKGGIFSIQLYKKISKLSMAV